MYASETWALKVEDEQRLVPCENAMVRWMCGVSLRNRCSMAELRERLGIQDVLEVARIGRLRWFGHLERQEESDWVTRCRFFEVEGK